MQHGNDVLEMLLKDVKNVHDIGLALFYNIKPIRGLSSSYYNIKPIRGLSSSNFRPTGLYISL